MIKEGKVLISIITVSLKNKAFLKGLDYREMYEAKGKYTSEKLRKSIFLQAVMVRKYNTC